MNNIFTSLLFLLIVSLFSSCKTQDHATPEENAAIITLEGQKGILQFALDQGGLTPEQIAAIEEQIAVLDAALLAAEKEIASRTTQGWFDFLPLGPLEPFKEVIVGVATLLFPRVRSNAKKAIKAVGRADWKSVLLSPFRLSGLVHTNGDPIEIMRGAAEAARSKGNEALAKAIEAQIDDLEPMQSLTS